MLKKYTKKRQISARKHPKSAFFQKILKIFVYKKIRQKNIEKSKKIHEKYRKNSRKISKKLVQKC